MYEKDDILAEANRISERIKSLDTVKDYHTVNNKFITIKILNNA